MPRVNTSRKAVNIRLNKIMSWIAAHPDTRISLAQMAELVHVAGPSTASRLINQLMSDGVVQRVFRDHEGSIYQIVGESSRTNSGAQPTREASEIPETHEAPETPETDVAWLFVKAYPNEFINWLKEQTYEV